MNVGATRNVRWLAILAGAFPSLDTAVNIAFPAIDEQFDLAVTDLQWIVISYLLTYGVLLVGAGRLGDAVGHRRLVMAGGALSAVGLGGCAVASTFGLFLVGRVMQGIGTALVLAGAPALLTTSASDQGQRGRAVSWFQAAAMAGFAIGPVVGGPLVAAAGWRAVFWFRIPIALGMVGLALSGPSRRRDEPRRSLRQVLLGQRSLARVNLLTIVANAAIFPVWLLVPTLLVDELGLAVILGGLVLAASPVSAVLGSLWAGDQVDRVAAKRLVRLGLALQAVGLAATGIAGEQGSVVGLVLSLVFVGAGFGIFSVPNMHQVMSSLGSADQGVAGGLSLMMRTIGVVAGVVAASALFDPIERDDGFGPALRWVFLAAAFLAFAGAFVRVASEDHT